MINPINQLEYNTDQNSKPIYFTSVPTSQPKPIIIQRIGFYKQPTKGNDKIEKPLNQQNSNLSTLELAVQLAKRDIQDEIDSSQLKKIKKVQLSLMGNDKNDKMPVSKNSKKNIYERNKNLKSLPARSYSPPTKDASSNNRIGKISNSKISNHKSQNITSNRRPIKQVSDIEQMSKEIVACITHLSQKLTTKLKVNDNLDVYDIERISSRVGDRHIRINRLLYSLNTDLTTVYSNFEKDFNSEQNKLILNLLIQCFRNVLRILRLLLQQLNDWLKVGLCHIQDLNMNVKEHLSCLISVCCDLMDICGCLSIFKEEDKFQNYILTLRNISEKCIILSKPNTSKNIYKINEEAVNKETVFKPKNSEARDTYLFSDSANYHDIKKNNMANYDNDNMNEYSPDYINELNDESSYFPKKSLHFFKRKPRVNYISKNKILFGGYPKRKLNPKGKLFRVPLAPPPTNRSDYKPFDRNYQNSAIVNRFKNDDNTNSRQSENTANSATNLLNKNQMHHSNKLQNKPSNFNLKTRLIDQLKSRQGRLEILPERRVAIEDLVERNHISQEVNDITNAILDETLNEVSLQRHNEQANQLSFSRQHRNNIDSKTLISTALNQTGNSVNFRVQPDIDIISRRLRDIELEKLDIRRRWQTIQYEEDFSRDEIDTATVKPILFTKTKPKIFPEISKNKIDPKLKTINLSQLSIENILRQREDYKICIHKLNYGREENMDQIYFNPETLLDKISDEIVGDCVEEISGEIEEINDQLVGNVCQSEIQICQ